MSDGPVLFVLVPEYADWEPALLAAGLRGGFGMFDRTFNVKTVGPAKEAVLSIGGFKTMPDYDIDSVPEDFSALILVGGTGWFTNEKAKRVVPLIQKAVDTEKVLGAICDASVFLAAHGFLNAVEHTSNGLGILKTKAAPLYTGEARYIDLPSVQDGQIVTASGLGFIEFARNVFMALKTAPAERIEQFYSICKAGFFPS